MHAFLALLLPSILPHLTDVLFRSPDLPHSLVAKYACQTVLTDYCISKVRIALVTCPEFALLSQVSPV
jgi:hypothetical protein